MGSLKLLHIQEILFWTYKVTRKLFNKASIIKVFVGNILKRIERKNEHFV